MIMVETNKDSNLYGALAYLLGIFSGVVIYLMKKEDPYVKFHAMQSILFGVATIVVSIVLGILAWIPGVNILLLIVVPLFWLVIVVLWLALMWKAFNGQKWKLPVLGDQAEKMCA